MRRRDLLAIFGGAAVVWPFEVRAEDRVRHIGVLAGSVRDEADPNFQAVVGPFEAAMKDAGWIEGRNLHADYRFGAGDPARLRTAAAELVALGPEVIYASTQPALDAVYRETHTIPIVFSLVTDPIGPGYVKSLAHPGGNVTGFISQEPSLGGKWVQILREIAPGTRNVGILYNPKTAPFAPPIIAAAVRGAGHAVVIVNCEVESDEDIDRAIASLARGGHGGLVVLGEPFAVAHLSHIIAAGASHRVPVMYGGITGAAQRGGLISYGFAAEEHFRAPASYVSRILNGEKPADLAVQTPTKYALDINLRTATALGLTIPTTLLATSDEVIE